MHSGGPGTTTIPTRFIFETGQVDIIWIRNQVENHMDLQRRFDIIQMKIIGEGSVELQDDRDES